MFARLFACLLFIIVASVPSIAAATSPSNIAPEHCGAESRIADVTVQDAFSYELKSPQMLMLIAALIRASPGTQEQVLAAAVDAATSPAEHEVQLALATNCPSRDVVVAAARVGFLIQTQLIDRAWKADGIMDSFRFSNLRYILPPAMAALDGDRLTNEQRRAALSPFSAAIAVQPLLEAASHSAADSTPTLATATELCSSPDVSAAPLNSVAPNLPRVAARSGTVGKVVIALSLSDNGSVQSAEILRDSVHHGPGLEDVLRSAILAVAATTFAPAIKKCQPVAGKFLYAVEFHSR